MSDRVGDGITVHPDRHVETDRPTMVEQLQARIEALTDMLEKIANHPDTPKLLASYARGELHPINPLTGQNNNKKAGPISESG